MSADANLIAGLRSLVDRLEERISDKDAEIERLLLELKHKRDIAHSAQYCLSCGLLAPHHEPWCGSPQMEIERLTRERDQREEAARWLFVEGGVSLESCCKSCVQRWPWLKGDGA